MEGRAIIWLSHSRRLILDINGNNTTVAKSLPPASVPDTLHFTHQEHGRLLLGILAKTYPLMTYHTELTIFEPTANDCARFPGAVGSGGAGVRGRAASGSTLPAGAPVAQLKPLHLNAECLSLNWQRFGGVPYECGS